MLSEPPLWRPQIWVYVNHRNLRRPQAERITQKLEAEKKSRLALLQASSFQETKETMQETMKQAAEETAQATAKEMAEWFARHRLTRYAEHILAVAGTCV